MSRDRLLLMRGFAGGVLAALLGALILGGAGRHSQGDRGGKQAPKTDQPRAAPATTDGKLRIIAFGAHPDDCELKVAGVGARWAALGHHVKFVSVTNGDIGHWRMAGGPLAQRRTAEVKKCAQILGIETEVLDIHDGELLPT